MSLYTEMSDDIFFIVENLRNDIACMSINASDFDIVDNYNESFVSEGENIFTKIIEAVKAIAKRVIQFIKDVFARIKEHIKPQKETVISIVKGHPELGSIKVETDRLHDIEELIKSRDDVRRAIMKDIAKGKTVTGDDVDNALERCNVKKKIKKVVITIGALAAALTVFATASFYKDRADYTEECEEIVIDRLDSSLGENQELMDAYQKLQDSWATDIQYASQAQAQALTVIKDTLTRLKSRADDITDAIRTNRSVLNDDDALDAIAQMRNTTKDDIITSYTNNIKKSQDDLNSIASAMQSNIDKYNKSRF